MKFHEKYKKMDMENLKNLYEVFKKDIENRLNDFKSILKQKNDQLILKELIFCLLTPQSKAQVCWSAVEDIFQKRLLEKLDEIQILNSLKSVRFKHNKTKYILELVSKEGFREVKRIIDREKYSSYFFREYLVTNIKGLGFKESSHFLRNIGLGGDLAILDRHILKNLKLLQVIDEIPKCLSKSKYLEIENQFKQFARAIDIPLDHLDLVLWCKETGKIFK